MQNLTPLPRPPEWESALYQGPQVCAQREKQPSGVLSPLPLCSLHLADLRNGSHLLLAPEAPAAFPLMTNRVPLLLTLARTGAQIPSARTAESASAHLETPRKSLSPVLSPFGPKCPRPWLLRFHPAWDPQPPPFTSEHSLPESLGEGLTLLGDNSQSPSPDIGSLWTTGE